MLLLCLLMEHAWERRRGKGRGNGMWCAGPKSREHYVGSHVYHGEWSTESDAQVHLQPLFIDWQAIQQAPPWSLVEQSGVVYRISKWYPTIEVDLCKISSLSAVCETHLVFSGAPCILILQCHHKWCCLSGRHLVPFTDRIP